MEWTEANDIKKELKQIITRLDLSYIDLQRIHCYRTQGSKAHAYARTWGFPKIFQHALAIQPAYVIEVLSQYFDTLSPDEKTKVLIHELLHIPKNFSGALLPHQTKHRKMHVTVNQLFKQYKAAKAVSK